MSSSWSGLGLSSWDSVLFMERIYRHERVFIEGKVELL